MIKRIIFIFLLALIAYYAGTQGLTPGNVVDWFNERDFVQTFKDVLNKMIEMESITVLFDDPVFLEQFTKTVLIIFAICFVTTLIAGMTNNVVIYFNFKDLFVSFMVTGIWVVAAILVGIYSTEGQGENFNTMQTIIMYISAGISAICAIFAIKLSVQYNRNFLLGVLVGVFKIVTALLFIVIVFGYLFGKSSSESEESSGMGALIFILLLGIFVWVAMKLVNGEEVYRNKEWELPV